MKRSVRLMGIRYKNTEYFPVQENVGPIHRRGTSVQDRNFTGQNKYNFLNFPDSKIQFTLLASYLVQSGLADGRQNIFEDGSGRYPPRGLYSRVRRQ